MSPPSLLSREYRVVAVFTLGYLFLATAYYIWTMNYEFLFYVAVVAILVLLTVLAYRRIRFTRGVLWGLALWGLAHLLGGSVPIPPTWPIEGERYVLYNLWIFEHFKYDNLVHGYGFAIATWTCYQALRSLLPSATPRLGILVLCVLSGMGVGALNEMFEFLITRFLVDNNVGGYVNTGWDLVYNFLGGVFAALVIHYGTADIPPQQQQ